MVVRMRMRMRKKAVMKKETNNEEETKNVDTFFARNVDFFLKTSSSLQINIFTLFLVLL